MCKNISSENNIDSPRIEKLIAFVESVYRLLAIIDACEKWVKAPSPKMPAPTNLFLAKNEVKQKIKDWDRVMKEAASL